MPYRHAHWALLLLAPIIALAFWPGYFGDLPKASLAFHAHGLTATFWRALVGFQSWSAHAASHTAHRLAGRAVFVAVPLFAGAAVLVLHSMATKFAEGSHPFYAALGARLGAHDIISTTALVALVGAAVAKRRNMALHGACMLSTAILVLPPVIARLPIPRFFHSGELIAIAIALFAAWAEPRGCWPFLVVAGVQVAHILVFETIAASDAWAGIFSGFSTQPVVPFAIAAVLAALAVLVVAWKRVPPRRSPVQPAQSPT